MPKTEKLIPLFKHIYNTEHGNASNKLRYEILEDWINEYQFSIIGELGAGMGFPAVYLLENCPSIQEYIAIDPGPPHNNRKEKFEADSFYSFKDKNGKSIGRFIHKTGLDAANEFADGYFDLVYMDHLAHIMNHISQHPNSPPMSNERIAKNRQLIKDNILAWLPKVKPKGIICGHDFGENYDYELRVTQAVSSVFSGTVSVIKERQNNIWWKRL